MPDYPSLVAALGISGQISGQEIRAKCPLHDDTNPSWSININTGLWTCFSRCGGGNFLSLVMRVLGCSWIEAHEWIENNGRGTSIESLMSQLEGELSLTQRLEVHQQQGFIWRNRYEQSSNRYMPQWFLDRGLTWETIMHFGIHYDAMMDAVVFPVYQLGVLVGTITRNWHQDLPKYVNSPDLPRAELVYGEISPTASSIILVEGVIDALWLWQNGYNAVSLLGWALTDGQIDILRSYRFGEVILALDNDIAGMKGTHEAVKKLTERGWLLPQITIMKFPTGVKDANDCDPQLIRQIFEDRKDILSRD